MKKVTLNINNRLDSNQKTSENNRLNSVLLKFTGEMFHIYSAKLLL